MSWLSARRRVAWCLSLLPQVSSVAVLILFASPASAEGAWGSWYGPPSQAVRSAASPPDQSWLLDVPEKPGVRSKGKAAVFVFRGDDVYQPVRAEVVRTLRRKGLNVTTTLRPVDSAAQYRELSYTLNMGVYVEGELIGEGARQNARIRLRSGVTGQTIASATFSGSTPKIVSTIGRTLWSRVGAATMRACSTSSRPHRREREPLRIDAGTPLDSAPLTLRRGT